MAPGRNFGNGSGDVYQYEYEPAQKQRRTHRSPSQSFSAAVGSDRDIANPSAMQPSRHQAQLTGTPSGLWRSRRPSAGSLEDYFARIDPERGGASFSSYRGAAAQALDLSDPDPSGALIAQLLGDTHPSAPMNAWRSSVPGDYSLGENDMGLGGPEISAAEFYAAFAVSDDELTRIGPAKDLDLGDADTPGTSGVHNKHVVSSRSLRSDADEGSESDADPEVDERRDSYYSDSLSESEDGARGAVDPGSMVTMDIAALGRRPSASPPPAPIDLEMIGQAERLEPSIAKSEEGETLFSAMIRESKPLRPMITNSEIKEFFGGLKRDSDGIRRNILAFIRVLDEHNISQLKDVPGAPAVRRGNISSTEVSEKLDLKKGYLEMLRSNVRKYEIKSDKAPEWMYKILKRLSLDDGLLGPLPGASNKEGGDIDDSALDVPEPSSVGALNEDAPPTYDEVLESAKALVHSLSNKDIYDYFKKFRYPDVINQRKVLAFIRALKKHGASRLDALVGYPAGEGGAVKLQEVAGKLELDDVRYFDRLATIARGYQKNGNEIPEWIEDVIDKLCVNSRENRRM